MEGRWSPGRGSRGRGLFVRAAVGITTLSHIPHIETFDGWPGCSIASIRTPEPVPPGGPRMTERNDPWVVVATFGAVWEADFAAETLREAGIPAQVDGGQNVAIFGIGYQGPTQFGVRVRVPWHRE